LIAEAIGVTRDQERFYKALFNDFEGYLEVRLINKGNVKPLFLTLNELLHYPTPEDTNVYIGMYERGRKGSGKIENCTKTNAIYLDFDGMALEEITYRIDNAGLPTPSMIVNSGHGYHVYWLLDKPVGHELKPVIVELAKLLQADTAAIDTARVLRVPDTWNVKGDPVQSRLIDFNGNRTPLEVFERLLDVKAHIEQPQRTGAITELLEINLNGLNNMATGVKKGERNFCTGRIVQTLKRKNYTKYEITEIVMKWNVLNQPVKDGKDVKREINSFWYENNGTDRMRFDGKEFSDMRLQELNERFIDADSTFFKGDETDTHNYDNELLHPNTFKKTKGLTFAVLSIIKLAEAEGIRREHLASLCKRDKTDRLLTESLKMLRAMKYVGVRKEGRVHYYVFTEKPMFDRGYTAVSKSLHRSYLNGELKEHEYKLMILLESYAFDNKKEIFPTNVHLAFRSGQSDRTVSRNLKQLEHKQFIKMEIKGGKRIIRFIYR